MRGSVERTLAVLGATGKTGREVVSQALARGWRVRALARDPARLPWATDARVTVVRGDAKDAARVRELVQGASAAVSALGHVQPSRGVRSPPDLLLAATKNLVEAMDAEGVRRLVVVTGGGVHAPQDRPGAVDRTVRWLLRRLQPAMLADAEAMRDVVTASSLDWTIARGGRMLEKPAKGKLRVGNVGETGPFVTHADLARFILDEIDARAHVRGMPMVSS